MNLYANLVEIEEIYIGHAQYVALSLEPKELSPGDKKTLNNQIIRTCVHSILFYRSFSERIMCFSTPFPSIGLLESVSGVIGASLFVIVHALLSPFSSAEAAGVPFNNV